MVSVVYGKEPSAADIDALMGGVQFLFAMRLTRYMLVPASSGVDPAASVMLEADGKLYFDETDFTRRYLLRNGLMARQGEFVMMVEIIRKLFVLDSRYYMNFSDFIGLLYAMLVKRRIMRAGSSIDELKRVYRAMLTRERLLQVPLLQLICTWLGINVGPIPAV
ncbi:MAG TPA: hypothetical protein VN843_12425 [Anaerolineales bacterium]|nr:hypothetical protein [Anaerolineales bacterium]